MANVKRTRSQRSREDCQGFQRSPDYSTDPKTDPVPQFHNAPSTHILSTSTVDTRNTRCYKSLVSKNRLSQTSFAGASAHTHLPEGISLLRQITPCSPLPSATRPTGVTGGLCKRGPGPLLTRGTGGLRLRGVSEPRFQFSAKVGAFQRSRCTARPGIPVIAPPGLPKGAEACRDGAHYSERHPGEEESRPGHGV